MGDARLRGRMAGLVRRRSAAWTLAAALVLWVALVAPYRPADLQPAAFLRLPLEGLLLVGLLLVLPARARRRVATLAGVILALLCLLKLLELGFRLALGRPFDALTDSGYAGSAVSLLFDSVGTVVAVGALAAGAMAVLGVLVVLPFATLRVAALVSAHRAMAARAVTALVAVWAGLAVSGVTVGAGPVAAASDARLVLGQARQISEGIRDEQRFERELAADPRASDQALTRLATLSGLRGKDVLVVFVESYGRFALEGPSSARVTSILDQGTRQLRQEGFRSRSAFLTSPTLGGTSWLVHSTLQSGLWIDSERRYDRLMESRHTTLTGLFGQAGWRTVMVIPSSERPWPEGERLYRFDTMYGGTDLGYTGPRFGYAKVPDQFTLEALHRLELAPERRRPVMAQVDLVSSHTPWTPLPDMVPWEDLGSGEIYEDMPGQGQSRAQVWSDRDRLQSAYTTSVVYSLRSLLGFVLRHGDDDLVLVVVGDHQPNSYVTGQDVGRDVPVSVIARDPAVIRSIEGWGWHSGLRPPPDAPVWRMDAFRGRFLDAYGE